MIPPTVADLLRRSVPIQEGATTASRYVVDPGPNNGDFLISLDRNYSTAAVAVDQHTRELLATSGAFFTVSDHTPV